MRRTSVAALIGAAVLGLPAAASAAGTSVTDATVQVDSLSASATDVTYTVTFRATHGLAAGTGTIILEAPAGTTLPAPGASCYDVADDSSGSHGCANTSVSGTAATMTVPAGVPIAAGDTVTVRVYDADNPTTTGAQTAQVSTSADPTAVSVHFSLTAEAAISRTGLQLTSTSAGATEVTYTLRFVSPGRIGYEGYGIASAITLTAPAGTVWPAPGANQYECFDATTAAVNQCNGDEVSVDNATDTATIYYTGESNPGDVITVYVHGVTNPGATGLKHLTVSTTSDPRPVSLSYTAVAAQPVSDPFLRLSSYAAGASGVTWSLGFVAPQRLTGGGLAAGGDSMVTIAAPAGTVFPSSINPGGCWDATEEAPNACAQEAVGNGGATLTVTLNAMADPGDVIALAIPGVTNPPAMTSASLATTSDPKPVTLSLAGPDGPTPVLQLSSDSASSGTRATQTAYAATFASPGVLAQGSTITLTAPASTVLPACATGAAGGYVLIDDTSGEASGLGPASCDESPGPLITLAVGGFTNPAAAGDVFTLIAFGVNSATATGSQTLALSSSSGASASFPFRLVSPTAIGAGLVQADSHSAAAPAVSYATTFTAANGFAPSSFQTWSNVYLTASSQTVFPDGGIESGDYALFNLTTGTGTAAGSPGGSGSAAVVPGSGDGFWAARGDVLDLQALDVANPPSAGSDPIGLATSGDPKPASLANRISAETAVSDPLLTLSSASGGAIGVTDAVTFRATGGLTPDYSTITLAFPSGTGFPPGSGDADGFTVYDDTTGRASGAFAQISGSTAVITPGTGDGFDAAPGDVVTILITPASNAAAGRDTVTLSTSSDPKPVSLPLTLS